MSRTRTVALLAVVATDTALVLVAPAGATDGAPLVQGSSNYANTDTGVFTSNAASAQNALTAGSLGNAGDDGVYGYSTRTGYTGVHGFAYVGPRVWGQAYSTSTGVKASSPSGLALDVQGKARFSRSGRVAVPAPRRRPRWPGWP